MAGPEGSVQVQDLLYAVAIMLPCAAVFYAVQTQSKVVAAFAQLSDIQEREDRHKDLVSKAIMVDRLWFMLGVFNVGCSAYVLGAFPVYYYLYYTPKVISLIVLRLVKFYRKKQHFLLWDMCYWANFACLYYCWLAPQSAVAFRVVFMVANGPVAWSVLAFNHAMIFHSYAHVTSVVVHTSPLLLTFGLRWWASPMSEASGAGQFRVCDAGPESCMQLGVWDLIGGALMRFYLWWLVLYYFWIFVALGSYVERNHYQTLWDRILVMKPVGPFLQRLLKKWPKLMVQLVYLLIHLGMSVVTMGIACILWYSQIAHYCFLFTIVMSTVRNAALFYFEVFESQYQTVIDPSGKAGPTGLSKKITSASGVVGEGKQAARLAAPLVGEGSKT